MQLRTALTTDIQNIANLHVLSWRHAYRGALSDEYLQERAPADRLKLWSQRLLASPLNQSIWVVEEQQELIGFACAFAGADSKWGCLLDNLHVHPSRHRQGIGAMLLKQVQEWRSQRHAQQALHLWVLQANLKAQAFYTRHGGRIVEDDVWQSPSGDAVPRHRMVWPPVRPI